MASQTDIETGASRDNVTGDGNMAVDAGALLLPTNVWTVPVNGYISPVLVLFTLTTNAVVCAVLLRPGEIRLIICSALNR